MGCLLFYFVRFVVNLRVGDFFYSVLGKGFWRVGGGERGVFFLMVFGGVFWLGRWWGGGWGLRVWEGLGQVCGVVGWEFGGGMGELGEVCGAVC